jgi:hypothetical protein
MLRRLFKRRRSKSPTFGEWKLVFSNGIGLSENPHRDSDTDLATPWEEGWEEACGARKAFVARSYRKV